MSQPAPRYDLRSKARLNPFPSASIPRSPTSDVTTTVALAALAQRRLAHLVPRPALQQDAQGQVEELMALINISSTSCPVTGGNDLQPFLSGPLQGDDMSDFIVADDELDPQDEISVVKGMVEFVTSLSALAGAGCGVPGAGPEQS
ncbi:hypothetical protein JCM3770_003021 [Rhodotorula araucariae]